MEQRYFCKAKLHDCFINYMLFWPVNKMIQVVSDMPAPQFGDESSSVQGSELVQAVPVFRFD
jgi:hypothetical protein